MAIAFLNALWYPKNTENTKGNRKGAEKKFFGIYFSEDPRGILDLTAQTVKHKKTFTYFKEVISHDKEITETESQERLHTR